MQSRFFDTIISGTLNVSGQITCSGNRVITTADTGSFGSSINTGFLLAVNNLSDVSNLRKASSNTSIQQLSPLGGGVGDTDQTGVAPQFEGQFGVAYYGDKSPVLYFGGSTTIGDWNHAMHIPGGITEIGDSTKSAASMVNLEVNLNGCPANWNSAGDSLLRVVNWSTSSGNSGGAIGIAVMTGITGQAVIYDSVGCAFAHVPAGRVKALIPGNSMLVFNAYANYNVGFAIASPHLSDDGNYSWLYADFINNKLRIPKWVVGAYQPSDAGWQDLFIADLLNGSISISGNLNITGAANISGNRIITTADTGSFVTNNSSPTLTQLLGTQVNLNNATTIFWTSGTDFYQYPLNANTTFAFTGCQNTMSIEVLIYNTGQFTVNWPSGTTGVPPGITGIKWQGQFQPVSTTGNLLTGKADLFSFKQINNTIYGLVAPNFY